VITHYSEENGGWRAIADQWLQPGGLDEVGVRVTSHLFSRELFA
jgi:hypothetical protein